MVKEEKKLWICEECNLKYKDRETAEECESFCKENKACNSELIKKAVK
jgi:hypothetical protein